MPNRKGCKPAQPRPKDRSGVDDPQWSTAELAYFAKLSPTSDVDINRRLPPLGKAETPCRNCRHVDRHRGA